MDEEGLRKLIGEETDKRLSRKMDDKERIQAAIDKRDIIHQNMLAAEDKSSAVADEFIQLEVQIATIIFAFGSLFLNSFSPQSLQEFSPSGILLMKLTFAFSLFSLLASLSFGLLHLKRKKYFWDGLLHQRIIRFKKWDDAANRRVSIEEAQAFQEGTAMDRGHVLSVSDWQWILQTIFLSMAVVLLFVLAIFYLFGHS